MVKKKLIAIFLTLTFPFWVVPLMVGSLIIMPVLALYDAMVEWVEEWHL